MAGLGEAAVLFEFESLHISAQQNPMIDIVEHQAFRCSLFQKAFAERVKSRQRHIFPAIAGGSHHASLHLAGGLVRKRQPENIFARKRIVRLQ